MSDQNNVQQAPPDHRTPEEIREWNAAWKAGYDAAHRDQSWPTLTETRQELSRARGEIDEAHVVLDAAGVHRSEGQALQDRIASYIGPMESKLEAAEASATAVEQERDKLRERVTVAERVAQEASGATIEQFQALEDKLAAAERREAEKDKRIAELVAHARYALPPYTGQRAGAPKFNPSAAKLILEVLGVPRDVAPASPSTPSPAPAAAFKPLPWTVCPSCQHRFDVLPDDGTGCIAPRPTVWPIDEQPSPSPRPERSEA